MPDENPEVRQSSASTKSTESSRGRLWRALVRPTRGQVTVGVLLALVGFAAVTQVHTNQVDDTYAGLRQQDLIDVLNGLADTAQRAQAEIERLEETRDQLLSDTTARQAAIEQARAESENLSILAGLIPVTGPGLRVTIKEVGGPVEIGPFIDMVQALRTAGAEGMQINGEVRVVAQTSFEDAEGGIIVDGKLLAAPYVVDVIGNPVGLAEALRFPDGPQDQFAENDIAELTFEELEQVEIEAVRELPEASFAEASGDQ